MWNSGRENTATSPSREEINICEGIWGATSMEITSKNMAVLQESRESEAVNKVTLQGDGTTDGTRRVDGRSMQYKSSCFSFGGNDMHRLAGLRNRTELIASKKTTSSIDV